MRILMVSTPIGYLGSGQGGGVELNLVNLAQTLQQRSHEIVVIAPSGSIAPVPLLTVAGTAPPLAQTQTELSLSVPSVLTEMWQMARSQANSFDLIVNWAYDWLPFYLTPFLPVPVLHVVSMGALQPQLSAAIAQVQSQWPGTVAVHSRAQAETFTNHPEFVLLPCGIDLAQYQFVAEPSAPLAWVGRLAPEKGLDDLAAVSAALNAPIAIYGHLQEPDYWQAVQARHPTAQLVYQGFLPTAQLQAALGRSRGLVMTPQWIEAFGMVAVEALACGVPVITYRRGGPAEIVVDGVTGWVVEPDSVAAVVAAVTQLDRIDRRACRDRAVQHYSLAAMADCFEAWLASVLCP